MRKSITILYNPLNSQTPPNLPPNANEGVKGRSPFTPSLGWAALLTLPTCCLSHETQNRRSEIMAYTSQTNIVEKCTDLMQRGQLTTAQANVLMVRMKGVRVVTNRIPREVRKALNDAVKAGELGHMKAEERKPEVYFNPNSRAKAIDVRNQHERNIIETMQRIAVSLRPATCRPDAGNADT